MKRLIGLMIATLPAAAIAHDLWLWPLPLQVQAPGSIDLGLRLGELGKVETTDFSPQRIERLWIASPQGKRDLPVTAAARDLAVEITGAGTHSIAYVSRPALSSLPGEKFDSYLGEEHLTSVQKAREGVDTSATVNEHYSRSVKALITTDDAALVDCPMGTPFELTILSLDKDGLTVRATFENRPLAGVWVDLADARSEVFEAHASDAQGIVSFKPRHGVSVVRATHMIASREKDIAWRSFWSSTIFSLAGDVTVEACR